MIQGMRDCFSDKYTEPKMYPMVKVEIKNLMSLWYKAKIAEVMRMASVCLPIFFKTGSTRKPLKKISSAIGPKTSMQKISTK